VSPWTIIAAEKAPLNRSIGLELRDAGEQEVALSTDRPERQREILKKAIKPHELCLSK
jgi:hypothetical protein